MADTCSLTARTGKIKCAHIIVGEMMKSSDESYGKGHADADSHAV